MTIFVETSPDLSAFNRSDAKTHGVRHQTQRDDTGTILRRLVPLIGLTVTVAVGMTLGLWMVFMAVTAAPTSAQAASSDSHVDAPASAASHSDAGVVPMPGLDPVDAREPSTADGTAHAGSDSTAGAPGMSAQEMAGMEGMEGMAPVDPAAAPSPTAPEWGDPMAAMSDQDMAALGHTSDAHTPAAADRETDRPLGATLAGFGLVNVVVLMSALVIGRRRARQPRSRQPQGNTPSRKAAASGTGADPGPTSFAPSTESARKPS